MSKTYKGWELMKAIEDGEIKDGDRLKFVNKIAETDITVTVKSNLDKPVLINEDANDFLCANWLFETDIELIEDEIDIDIDSIEELNDEAKRLFEAIMKIANERDKLQKIVEQKDKIIDLMAERAVLTEEEWKEIKEKNIYNVIQKDTHKLIKQYFENKAKEVKNGKYID